MAGIIALSKDGNNSLFFYELPPKKQNRFEPVVLGGWNVFT